MFRGIYRNTTWHLYSDGPDGQRIDVCYVGTEIHKNYILEALFPKTGRQHFLGVQHFWRLKHFFPKRQHYDVIILERDTVDDIPDQNRLSWFIPRWIKSYVDIPIQKTNHSLKMDLRLIGKQKLDYRVTTDENETARFYHDMYLPYIRRRHQDRSLPTHFDELQNAIAEGNCELLLVKDEFQTIAGVVIDYKGMLPNIWLVGVLNGINKLLAKAAVPACTHFSFSYLLDKGYSRVSLGFSRAFIHDGPLNFKMKFGAKLFFPTVRGFVLYPLRYSDAFVGLLANNPFIYVDDYRMHLASFVTDEKDVTPTLSGTLEKYEDTGLASSQIFLASEHAITLASSQPFEKIMTKLPTASNSTKNTGNPIDMGRFFLRHLMNMRSGQSMLLYTDEASDKKTTAAIVQAAESMDIDVYVHELELGQTKEVNSEKLMDLLENHQFHTLCETSSQYFYNTPVWRKAHRKNVSTYGLGPLSLDSFTHCVGQVDHHEMYSMAQQIEARLRKAAFVRITQDNGTDLHVGMNMPFSYNLL